MIEKKFQDLSRVPLTPLDLLPQDGLREKIVELVLNGVPHHIHKNIRVHLEEFQRQLMEQPVDQLRVVVFGGGTGLSNIIGGDSRQPDWVHNPFAGLKQIFPRTRSVVCVTDNGGSTGELLKDLDLLAIGDIRHVLLSSIQRSRLEELYQLDSFAATELTVALGRIFNFRFTAPLTLQHHNWSLITGLINNLPGSLRDYLQALCDLLFYDPELQKVLNRPHCFGNLLVAASIYREKSLQQGGHVQATDEPSMHRAIGDGLTVLARVIGAGKRAVMPCTSTPAQLRIRYANGVEIAGEHRLSSGRRRVPVESIEVEYCGRVQVYKQVLEDIAAADIIILAPGSLYSSIIPVFKVPGLADAVRKNTKALKILVSNLWVQAGETDLSNADPERKFHVSDMIGAYEKNIPGGTAGLFKEVLCVSLQDIPASILQSYAVEGKIPIYLDKDKLVRAGFIPVESEIYSKEAITRRGVIQHDAHRLALAIKGLFNGRTCYRGNDSEPLSPPPQSQQDPAQELINEQSIMPCKRYGRIRARIQELAGAHLFGLSNRDRASWFAAQLIEIIWDHPIIPLSHLDYCRQIRCIEPENWNRDQKWDNVFSFYDPDNGSINIRADQIGNRSNLEVALMIALGESLLGNYARLKEMKEVCVDSIVLGRVYHLFLHAESERNCFLNSDQLKTFLLQSRMSGTGKENHYTRLLNRDEGFTPPGLLMGLMYAWYVDNRLATHIEYKMSVLKINRSDLIPEQLKMVERRQQMIDLFREVVFASR